MTGTGDPFAELTTAELERMRDRAYRDAVRCWREVTEAKRRGTIGLRPILVDSAMEADRWYRMTRDAAGRRGRSS